MGKAVKPKMVKLIKYDIRKNAGLLLAMLATIFAVEGYFLISLALDKETHVAVSSSLMPVGCFLIALLVFILGVTSYSRELSQKSSYLIFMTPRSTLAIIASKVLYTVVLGVGFAGLLGGLLALDIPLLLDYFGEWKGFAQMLDSLLASQNMSLAGMIFTALFFALMVFCQVLSMVGVAYLAITLSSTLLQNRKGKGVVSVVFFLALTWGLSRLSGLWYDDPYFLEGIETFRDAMKACLPQLAQSVAVLLASVFGSAWLLERYVSL